MTRDSSKPLTQPFRDVGTVSTPEERRRRFRMTVVVALLALTIALGWTAHALRESLSDLWTQNLQTLLEANVQSLEIWLENEKRNVSSWAQSESLRLDVTALVDIARAGGDPARLLTGSDAALALREKLAVLQTVGEIRGYLVVDPGGLVLAAHNDHLVAERLAPPLLIHFSPGFAGEVSVIRPYRGLALLPDKHTSTPVMMVAAPVRPDGQNVLAVLVFRIDANADFSRILAVARMGETGETYAFDGDGFMLTRSRFKDQLMSAGLLPEEEGASAVLQVQVRDPGGDLTRGFKLQAPSRALPLTRMAASAIAGQAGVNLDGYRDYRGVEVIGAWRWLPQYGFGVATEMSKSEAFRLLRPMTLAFAALVVLLVLTTGALVVGSRLVDRLKTQMVEVQRLGQYQVTDKIGEGGMAIVYRARHHMLRRPTAVKVLKSEIVSPDTLARFEQEVQLTSELTHPNTIEIYDYGRTPEGTFYYAMEYLDGISLADLILHEGAVQSQRVIHILKQVCGSLAEAHQVGLVHRDIKPANILLCERGGNFDVVKVLDFGLVKGLDADRSLDLTAANVVAGTPQYVAPERFKDPGGIDGRSDLYSLGAVGFNLLTGTDVFKAGTSMEMCHHVLNTPPPRPSDRAELTIPDTLDDLIHRCLAKQPEERPGSALDMLERLEAIEVESTWSREDAAKWWRIYREDAAGAELRNVG